MAMALISKIIHLNKIIIHMNCPLKTKISTIKARDKAARLLVMLVITVINND
jgi:hypothetical protein